MRGCLRRSSLRSKREFVNAVNDLLAMGTDRSIVVEYPVISPALLEKAIDPRKTVFLISDMNFQRAMEQAGIPS